ncbi:MAG: cohesin domain-containing protein [Acidobacteriota bacterium]
MRRGTAGGITARCLIALLASGWVGTGALPAASSDDAVHVWMSPTRTRPREGSLFSVYIRIRNARQVGSVPFSVVFDPEILEYVPSRSREGSFLRRDGAATVFLATAGTGRSGLAGVSVGLSRLRSDRGVSGRGILCKLTFRAKAPGTSRLDFTRARVLGPRAQPLVSVFEGKEILVRKAR